MSKTIEGFLGLGANLQKSRTPAKQDFLQSASGALLAVFMLCHMIFTGTIIFGKEAFEAVVRVAEPGGISLITNIVAAFIFVVFVVHAFLAMRKFPANFAAFKAYRAHKIRLKHCETSMWWVQFLSGFALFFVASCHLLTIVFTEPVSATLSASRFATLHIFYIVLLVAVVVHASVGCYRLVLKWVSLGEVQKERSQKRKRVKFVIFGVWAVLFVLSVVADVVWLSL